MKINVGDLVALCNLKETQYTLRFSSNYLGIVTGFSNTGWIFITWHNGVSGQWPYHKVKLVTKGKQNEKI